ncbi:MAG: copper amine oxidase N-terminal domain-containing protein [Caldisericia bacterium]|nr:copper amine oxidase N-terminal domain-containing protein [Caldisericia bacterium]
MLFKRVSIFLISAIIFVSFFSIGFSTIGFCSSEWVEVITDSKDTSLSADIKSVSVKDDGKNWSFKMESWGDWNVEKYHGAIVLHFNTAGSRNPEDNDYALAIFQTDDIYFGFFSSLESSLEDIIVCEFKPSDSIGTFSISKKSLLAKKGKFSLRSYIIYLPEKKTYLDAAPDDQKMKLFKGNGKPPETKLGVNVCDLKFGEVQKNATEYLPIRVFNEGAGTITGTITCTDNIRSSRSNFTLDDFDEKEISIIVDGKKLDQGVYSESIRFESDHGNETIQVTFEILPEPLLGIDVETIDFGDCLRGQNIQKRFIVYNKRKGPITGTLSSKNPWMRTSTEAFSEHSQTITLALHTKRIDPGEYNGSIRIRSNGGTETILVTMNLLSSYIVDKEEIDFGKIDIDTYERTPIPYTITNNSGKKLDITISKSDWWISTKCAEIELEDGKTQEFEVEISTRLMKETNFQYEGLITIESKYDTVELPVKAYIGQKAPELMWVKDEEEPDCVNQKLFYGTEAFEHVFIFKNSGSGLLENTYEIDKSDANFRIFAKQKEFLKDESAEVKIKLKTKNLELGMYNTVLSVKSNGGDIEIPITVEIIEKPKIIIKLSIGLKTATINGEEVILDEAPYINNGTTMVPLRFIGEAFNAEIEWFNIEKGRIEIRLGEDVIQLDIGKTIAYINDEEKVLTVPPEIKSGRTFVPIRFVSEALGAKIEWNGALQTITITFELDTIPEEDEE